MSIETSKAENLDLNTPVSDIGAEYVLFHRCQRSDIFTESGKKVMSFSAQQSLVRRGSVRIQELRACSWFIE